MISEAAGKERLTACATVATSPPRAGDVATTPLGAVEPRCCGSLAHAENAKAAASTTAAEGRPLEARLEFIFHYSREATRANAAAAPANRDLPQGPTKLI